MSNNTTKNHRLLYIFIICICSAILIFNSSIAKKVENTKDINLNVTHKQELYNNLTGKKTTNLQQTDTRGSISKPMALAGISVALEASTETKKDSLIVLTKSKDTKKKNTKKESKKPVKKNTMQKKHAYSKEEVEILQRIVEAEATGGSVKSKMNVASVILNRVKSDKFPDTIKEVVFQTKPSVQFSPIKDDRYYEVKITKSTIKAVDNVLRDGDVTKGALFFCNLRDVKSNSNVAWFNKLIFLFIDDIGHYFYK